MIPANLKYQSKAESVPGRRYLTQVQPQGSTSFAQGETITINIPTRNNTALIPSESYLRGQVNITASAAATTAALESCGFHNFIQRVRVFHGSNLLEDIDNYGQLAKILYDYQAPEDAVKGRFNITTGTNNAYSADGAAAGVAINARSVNRGVLVSLPASTTSLPFAINLVSLVGSLAGDKYLPLWEMTAAPLRVEIVLQPTINRAMMVEGGTITNNGFTMTGVNYSGEFLELPDSAIAAIKAGSSNPMQMVLPSWRSYTNSALLTTGTTQVSFPIPAKFSSLKSILVATRGPQAGTPAHYPSSHCTFGVGSSGSSGYQFRIGSEVLPSTAPVTLPEIYNEALKCFGSLADMQVQPSIDSDAFSRELPGAVAGALQASTRDSGAFLIGIDTEIYQNADKASIFAGTNTNTSDIFAIINYVTSSTFTVYQTGFACYDQVLVYENGVCYSRY